MDTHSSILAWRIWWTGEPGGLQSTESQRVVRDRSNLARTCIHIISPITEVWEPILSVLKDKILKHKEYCSFSPLAIAQYISWISEISPEYSLTRLMLQLWLQYFGHLMQRTDSLENTLILGKIEAGGEGYHRRWNSWMPSLTQWTWIWASSGSWWWTGKPGVLQSMGSQRVRHNWGTELNWYSSVSYTSSKNIRI